VVHKPDGSIDISPQYDVTSKFADGVVGDFALEMWGPANAGLPPPATDPPAS
jgi:hypothetical protein